MNDSDTRHHRGNKFVNPYQIGSHGFWKTLKMLVQLKFKPWPKHCINQPALNTSANLAAAQVAITWVNHATVLIQLPGLNVLTDPVWEARVSPFSFVGPKRVRAPGIAFEDLPRIDLVLLSHNHYDHMELPSLRRLAQRDDPHVITPLKNAKYLKSCGLSRITELDWWQAIDLNEKTRITVTPAQHFSGRGLFDRNKALWGGFMIEKAGKRLFFAGDTGYAPHFSEIHERFGPPDLAFLPIGAYEPRWFMRAVHTDPIEAVQAHQDLASKCSIAIHFNTFQLTEEAIDAPRHVLHQAMAARNLASDTFRILAEGQTLLLDL